MYISIGSLNVFSYLLQIIIIFFLSILVQFQFYYLLDLTLDDVVNYIAISGLSFWFRLMVF